MRLVDRTLDILEAVLYHDEVGLSELADLTGLEPSAVRRFTSALTKRGYLFQKGKGGKYSLGIKLLQYANPTNISINIRELILPFLKKLSDDTSETVLMTVFNGIDAITIATFMPKQVLSVIPDIGTVQKFPLHCTSLGKILLAYMKDDPFENLVKKLDLKVYTDDTITDIDKLKSELAIIKRNGVAFDDEEYIRGIRSVAVRIKGENEAIIAAVCMVCPTSRINREKMRQLVPLVKSCAATITKSLGYYPEQI
jgi:IclR family KDG regulon transcriptional repressor